MMQLQFLLILHFPSFSLSILIIFDSTFSRGSKLALWTTRLLSSCPHSKITYKCLNLIHWCIRRQVFTMKTHVYAFISTTRFVYEVKRVEFKLVISCCHKQEEGGRKREWTGLHIISNFSSSFYALTYSNFLRQLFRRCDKWWDLCIVLCHRISHYVILRRDIITNSWWPSRYW